MHLSAVSLTTQLSSHRWGPTAFHKPSHTTRLESLQALESVTDACMLHYIAALDKLAVQQEVNIKPGTSCQSEQCLSSEVHAEPAKQRTAAAFATLSTTTESGTGVGAVISCVQQLVPH